MFGYLQLGNAYFDSSIYQISSRVSRIHPIYAITQQKRNS